MKIKAVVFATRQPVKNGNENQWVWFKDPARNILLLRLSGTAPPEELSADGIFFGEENLREFTRERGLEPHEILAVTDQESGFGGMQVFMVPLLSAAQAGDMISADRIIHQIYLIEHRKDR